MNQREFADFKISILCCLFVCSQNKKSLRSKADYVQTGTNNAFVSGLLSLADEHTLSTGMGHINLLLVLVFSMWSASKNKLIK